jgi:putative cardiolipin synthase
LEALRQQGVQVSVLTNSLEATDVSVVHAGYAKHRQALLRAGVRLYELRSASGVPRVSLLTGLAGSSAASLHAKTFAVDGERLFVGSFNFDPRSAALNTELGFVIESPTLASEVATAFDHALPKRAYELRLASDGAITWTERADGKPPPTPASRAPVCCSGWSSAFFRCCRSTGCCRSWSVTRPRHFWRRLVGSPTQ